VTYAFAVTASEPKQELRGAMPHSTKNAFINHMKQRLDLAEYELPRTSEWSNVGNTIGALALRLGALTIDQLEEILTVQEEDGQSMRFGEVAVELGFLDAEQVDRLLAIQKMNQCIEMGEQLVLSGALDLAGLLDCLREFMHARRSATA
jgi:hypothetical protein